MLLDRIVGSKRYVEGLNGLAYFSEHGFSVENVIPRNVFQACTPGSYRRYGLYSGPVDHSTTKQKLFPHVYEMEKPLYKL